MTSSTTTASTSPAEAVRTPRSVPLVGDEPTMRDWADELVARARTEGVELTGDGGLLTALVRQVLQTGLEVEMTDHLGYEPHAVEGRGSGNSRNGSYPKTVTTEIGKVDLRVPRDRNASFDPVTVPKGQRRLDGLTGNVVSLYAKGMTTGHPGPPVRHLRHGDLPGHDLTHHRRGPRGPTPGRSAWSASGLPDGLVVGSC